MPPDFGQGTWAKVLFLLVPTEGRRGALQTPLDPGWERDIARYSMCIYDIYVLYRGQKLCQGQLDLTGRLLRTSKTDTFLTDLGSWTERVAFQVRLARRFLRTLKPRARQKLANG